MTRVCIIGNTAHFICVVFIGFERPWIYTPKIKPQLLMTVHYSSTGRHKSDSHDCNECKWRVSLSWCRHLVFFSSSRLHPCGKPPFFCPRCKSCLRRERSLAASSNLSMWMSIALMSILQTSSVLQSPSSHVPSGHVHVQQDLRNPPISRLLLVVAVSQSCSVISRVQAWVGFYERFEVTHAARFPSTRYW